MVDWLTDINDAEHRKLAEFLKGGPTLILGLHPKGIRVRGSALCPMLKSLHRGPKCGPV